MHCFDLPLCEPNISTTELCIEAHCLFVCLVFFAVIKLQCIPIIWLLSFYHHSNFHSEGWLKFGIGTIKPQWNGFQAHGSFLNGAKECFDKRGSLGRITIIFFLLNCENVFERGSELKLQELSDIKYKGIFINDENNLFFFKWKKKVEVPLLHSADYHHNIVESARFLLYYMV